MALQLLASAGHDETGMDMTDHDTLRLWLRVRGVSVDGEAPRPDGRAAPDPVPFLELEPDGRDRATVVVRLRNPRELSDRPVKSCRVGLRAASRAVRTANLMGCSTDQLAETVFEELARVGVDVLP